MPKGNCTFRLFPVQARYQYVYGEGNVKWGRGMQTYYTPHKPFVGADKGGMKEPSEDVEGRPS